MYVALPAPAWILLGYNAILWTKVSNHSAAAKVYGTALTKSARSKVHDGTPPQDQWNRLARTVFGLAGSRLLSYGVALALIIGFTAATVWRGRDSSCWFRSGVVVYSFALLIIGAAWLRISYAESRPNCFKRCMDWICVQRRYRPRHGARSETTIDDERVRVTTWSFEKAGDSTGAHVHEYDYVVVPVTGGTLTAVSTTDGSARTITQVAGSPYTGQAGLAHTVTADADGIVFVEVELKN